jgi:tetratricopeptide (TPR) repeat protein
MTTDEERRAEGWIQQALTLRARGHVEAAIEALRQVLGFDPLHARAHAEMALCLASRGRLAAARAEIKAAAAALEAAEDRRASGIVRIAAARLALAEGRDKAAEQGLRGLPEAMRAHPEALRVAAALARRRGQVEVALAAIERGLARAPEDLELLRWQVELLVETGEMSGAKAALTTLVQAGGERPAAAILRGQIAAAEGQMAEALAAALAALRVDPESVGGLRLLAAVLGRGSWWERVWWRIHLPLAGELRGGGMRVMLGLFLMYRLALILAEAHGTPAVVRAVTVGWLALLGYSFVTPELVRRRIVRAAGGARIG